MLNKNSIKIFILFSLFSFTTPDQKLIDCFRWGTKEIVWEDYKGSPTANGGSDAVTVSFIHMGVEYPTNLSPEITIETLFDRKNSWVKNKTPSLLLHEKGHFDIGELFARKLRKEVLSGSFKESTFEDEIFKIHRTFCMQMNDYQDKYDAETNYSRNSNIQKVWTASIESQLTELKMYSDGLLKVNLKK